MFQKQNNDFASYLVGQNCTSSTVSSCPLYMPRAPTEGLSAFPLVLSADLDANLVLLPEEVDFAPPGSVANVEI